MKVCYKFWLAIKIVGGFCYETKSLLGLLGFDILFLFFFFNFILLYMAENKKKSS